MKHLDDMTHYIKFDTKGMGKAVAGILLGVESGISMDDLIGCGIKALVFSVIVVTICCYQGYYTHTRREGHGAKGVGFATTSAVVISCVIVLISDYVLTSFLL